MSIFASQVTATHAFDVDPSHSFTVRKMSASELREHLKRFSDDVEKWADWMIRTFLTGWTYPQEPDGINGLVDEAVDQITTAICKLTKPSAYEATPEVVAEAQKND